MSYQYTAEFRYLELALAERKKAFELLENEMSIWKPRPISDWDEFKEKERNRIKELNPSMSYKELDDFVQNQIELAASERIQLSNAFSDRFMTEFISIVILSHALCEALINAIIALGLTQNKLEGVFALIEKADIKEKWLAGPKSFNPSYNFPKNSHLYETLNFLCKQRNAFVHYKITLHAEGRKVLDGSGLERLSFQDGTKWTHRFLSLPYDLHKHACSELSEAPIFIFGLLHNEINKL